MNNSFYIQIWGEQKHPKPEIMKNALLTKEYFEREKESGGSKTATSFSKNKVIKYKLFKAPNLYHSILI